MKIALLCHQFGNIGHPFMQRGLINIIRQKLPNATVHAFEQHNPLAHLAFGRHLRELRYIKHGRALWLKRLLATPAMRSASRSLLALMGGRYDLVITAGGPSFVRDGWNNFEQHYLYHCLYDGFKARGERFFDLSLGSCVPLDDVGYSPSDLAFFREAFEGMAGISARDPHAYENVKGLHGNVAYIPCPATWAFDGLARHVVKSKSFLVNYMPLGANETWGRSFDADRFAATMRDFIASVPTHGLALKFVCHSRYEFEAAQAAFPGHSYCIPSTAEEYAAFAADCIGGVASRLHCAIPLARLGVPMLLIGQDTRLGTAEAIGLPTADACTLERATLDAHLDKLLGSGRSKMIAEIEARTTDVPTRYAQFLLEKK
jgi:polysaccharide pyruvyl transferase WcaK-like protein